MGKLTCPHCGEPAVSVIRKTFMGPVLPAWCKACGREVKIPYIKGYLALIPGLAAITVAFLVEPDALKAAVFVGGWIVTAIIHVLWVPLVR